MKEYKILQWNSIPIRQLEGHLNTYALQGWKVITLQFEAAIVLVVLERDKPH